MMLVVLEVFAQFLELAVLAVLQVLQLMQHLAAVEGADVARLRRREPTYRPAEVHEVRLHRMRERMHPDLVRKSVTLARVAGAARRDDVRPLVRASARQR